MGRMLALLMLLISAGCASPEPTDSSAAGGKCVYAVSAKKGQRVVWAPCAHRPPNMTRRLSENREN